MRFEYKRSIIPTVDEQISQPGTVTGNEDLIGKLVPPHANC